MEMSAKPSHLGSSLSRWWVILILLLVFTALLTGMIHTALGNVSIEADFFTFWMAGRQFFLERQSPYSDEVAFQTQMHLYGRPAQGNEDRLGYAYPVYNLLPLLPFILLDFSWASSAWFAFNLVVLLAALLIAARKALKPVLILIPFLYPFAFCLLLGNYPILLCVILLLFYATFVQQGSRSKGLQILFGILLAWTTSKPQFVWLHLAFILLFALRERMWPFLVSLAAALITMLGSSLLWLPGWISMWITRVFEYTSYHQYKTEMVLHSILRPVLPEVFLTPTVVILLLLVAVFTARLFYLWWQGRLAALAVAAWAGFVTYAIDPYGLSYAQITFWIAIILWAVMTPKSSSRFNAFWVLNFILSWALFALALNTGWKAPVRDWPLLVYLPWLLWLLRREIRDPLLPRIFLRFRQSKAG